MIRVVQKYGGTSVSDVDKIKHIAEKVIHEKERGKDVVVVVSAMNKTTDNLIKIAYEICKDPCKRELDTLMATGEQKSAALLSMALKKNGYDAISLTGFQAGIKTEGTHMKNRIKDISIGKIEECLHEGKIVVVAGFQGINDNGDITTLGRGGSDTTAVALAAKLNCPCEIYTDVDGIYTIDPRLFNKAKKYDYISYEEMIAMASMGAKVMEVRAVQLAKKYNVPIYVALNSGDIQGSYIKEVDTIEQRKISGLTVINDIAMISIKNVLYKSKYISRAFKDLSKEDIDIDMISKTVSDDSLIDISFICPKEKLHSLKRIYEELKNELPNIEIDKHEDVTKISIIGIGIINDFAITSTIFKVFLENNISFKNIIASKNSISYVISKKDMLYTINKLAEKLDL